VMDWAIRIGRKDPVSRSNTMARSVPIVQSQAGSQGAKSIAAIPSTTTILRQSATAVNLSKPLAKVLQLQPQDLRS